MTEQAAGRGLTERLLARAIGLPKSGSWVPHYTVYLIVSVCWSFTAVGFTLDGRRVAAFIDILLAAYFGGALAVVAAHDELPSWRRALASVVNISTEGAMIAAAAVWAREHQDLPMPLAVGFLAFAGAILLSYTRTRIAASAKLDLADGPWGIASREVRLILLAVGFLSGQVYWALVVIAVLAHAAVAEHLARMAVTLRG